MNFYAEARNYAEGYTTFQWRPVGGLFSSQEKAKAACKKYLALCSDQAVEFRIIHQMTVYQVCKPPHGWRLRWWDADDPRRALGQYDIPSESGKASGKHINKSDQSERLKELQYLFDAAWELLVTAHGGDWSLAYAEWEIDAGRLKMQRDAYIKKHRVV